MRFVYHSAGANQRFYYNLQQGGEESNFSIELILIDDGSLDNSGKLCDDFEKRFPFVRTLHQSNSGPSAARNAGLQIASGDYILFVDSDDCLLPSSLELITHKLSTYSPDVIAFKYNLSSEDNKETYPVLPEYTEPVGGLKFLEGVLTLNKKFRWFVWPYCFKTSW